MKKFEKELQVIEKTILNSFTIDDRTHRVQLFKKALHKSKELLYELHKKGASGRDIVSRLTTFSDYVLQAVYKTMELNLIRDEGPPAPQCTLIAVGGYGRGELNPQSDVDVLFIFEKDIDKKIERLVTDCLYFFWDIGLDVGYSSRSVGECLHLAKEQLDSGTSMLESRFLAGQPQLFALFRENIEYFFQRQEQRTFVAEKIYERDLRYKHYDESIYVQEPNVKESAGGLRDVHFVQWLGKVLYNCDSLYDLYKKGYCTLEEYDEVEKAVDFLFKIRNELHFSSNLKKDQLTFDDQAKASKALGFRSSKISLAPEKLMQQYYQHAKVIHLFQQNFIEQYNVKMNAGRDQAVPAPVQVAEGFVLANSKYLEIDADDSIFRKEPCRIMEIFRQQHMNRCQLGSHTKGIVRNIVGGLDSKISRDSRFLNPLLELLGEEQYCAPVLRTMHELGLLGKIIPEFGKLTCFVQYDYNHRYTADEHTIRALEILEGIPLLDPKDPGLGHIPEICSAHVHSLGMMRLTILLHDVGKAMGPRHVERSARVVPRVARRFGLSQETTELVEFLVRQHITMSHMAQLRDPDDEKTINDFANTVANLQRLQLLYLLTYCDMSATAPGLWTIWKSMLLEEVYQKAVDIITLEEHKIGREEYFERIKRLVAEKCPEDIPRESVDEHFEKMPRKYFFATAIDTVHRHLELLKQMQGRAVVTSSKFVPEFNYTELIICARDHIGLLSEIFGVLSFHRLNILSAQVYTRSDGIALDTFKIVGEIDGMVLEAAGRHLDETIRSTMDIETYLRQDYKYLTLKRRGKFHVVTHINFDNDASEEYTIADIQAHDRMGLLFVIAKTLSSLNVDIRFAKIFTEGDQALDVFYIQDSNGKKIIDSAALEKIEGELRKALTQPATRLKHGPQISRLPTSLKFEDDNKLRVI